MPETHVTVKLSLSLLPNGQCRARIDESPAGASRGPGSDFDLPAAPVDGYPKLLKDVGTGARPIKDLEDLGKVLFKNATDGFVGQTFSAARALAQNANAYLRIAISVLSPEMLQIPWEYFHDGNGFLLQDPKVHIVRVLDELPGQMAPFRPFTHLLVAVANPAGMARFDADDHLRRIKALLKKMKIRPTIVFPATRKKLLDTIENKDFNAFYFLGHGAHDGEGKIFLENDGGMSDPLAAPLLAVRLAKTKKPIYFAYFNSCDTAGSDGQTTFSGVAQRVLSSGRIPAVLAQQAPVRDIDSMEMAEAFLRRMKDGESPEAAVSFARSAATGSMWGVPVLYTHLRGPEEFDRNRIECLLEANHNTRFTLHLASFRMGIRSSDHNDNVKITGVPEGTFRYRGVTHPRTAIMAAFEVLDLLSKIVPWDQIAIASVEGETTGNATHQFFFGSYNAAPVMNAYGAKFQFDEKDKWVLRDSEFGREYRVPDLTVVTGQEFAEMEDYGIIEKMVDKKSNRVFFVIAGFGDRATRGCAWYLRENWSEILTRHTQGSFAMLLELPKGLKHFDQMRRIDRKTGQPISASE